MDYRDLGYALGVEKIAKQQKLWAIIKKIKKIVKTKSKTPASEAQKDLQKLIDIIKGK